MQQRIEQGKTYTRYATVERSAVDVEKRTAHIAFSSETPVERWGTLEILSHAPGAMRMDRLANGAAVLREHDRKQHIGVVESATCDADKSGRALVRLGRSAAADEALRDIADGILRHVSVGYMVHAVAMSKREEGKPDEYTVTDWEPMELSFVAIPADPSVGVGRAAEPAAEPSPEVTNRETPKPQEQEKRTMPENMTVVDHTDALKAERARVAEITAIGKRWKLEDKAATAIANGDSLEAFRALVLDAEAEKQKNAALIGMNPKEVRQFSLVRAINAAACNDWSDAGLEREAMRAAEKQYGRKARGILVPEDVLANWYGERTAQNKTTVGAGGYLVGTQYTPSQFVEALLANTTFLQTGVRMLTGLVQDIDIPSQLTATTNYWVGEQTDVTESSMTFGEIALAPKTAGAMARATRKMLLQANPSIEALIRDDITKTVARAIDLAGYEGTGTLQPTGIVNLGGTVNSVAFGGAPSWGKIVDLRTAVAADKVPMDGSACYVGSPEFVGKCLQTEKTSTNGQYLMTDANRLNGYRFLESTNITNTNLFFGVFSNAIVAMWGGLDILVDSTTYAAQGGLRLIALQDLDIGFRYDKAFAFSTGMTV